MDKPLHDLTESSIPEWADDLQGSINDLTDRMDDLESALWLIIQRLNIVLK